MKKLTAISLVLSIALLLFAGCEKQQGVQHTSKQTAKPNSGDLVWQTEFHTVDAGSFLAKSPVVDGDTVYFFADVEVPAPPPLKIESTEGMELGDSGEDLYSGYYNVAYESRLFAVDTDGTNYREFGWFVPSKAPQKEGVNGDYRIAGARLGADSSLFVAEIGYFSYLDGTGQWAYNNSVIIRKFDLQTGSELQAYDIAAIEAKYPEVSIEQMAAAGDGSLVTAARYSDKSGNRQLMLFSVFDKSGKNLKTYEYEIGMQDIRLNDLFTLPDGRVAALLRSEKSNDLRLVDLSSGELQQSIGTLPPNFGNVIGFTDSGEYLTGNFSGIDCAKPGDAVSTEYISWLECDVDSFNLQFLGVSGGKVLASTMTYGSFGITFSIIEMKKVPRSEAK